MNRVLLSAVEAVLKPVLDYYGQELSDRIIDFYNLFTLFLCGCVDFTSESVLYTHIAR